MPNVNDIIDYENGEMLFEDEIEMFQRMIDNGSVWFLQGSYQRTTMEYINSGYCSLGKKGFKNQFGAYIPSRYEVKEGERGSVGYVQKMMENAF